MVGLAIRFTLESEFSGGKDDEEVMLGGVFLASTRDSQLLAGAEKRFNMNQCTGESNKTMDSLAVPELLYAAPYSLWLATRYSAYSLLRNVEMMGQVQASISRSPTGSGNFAGSLSSSP